MASVMEVKHDSRLHIVYKSQRRAHFFFMKGRNCHRHTKTQKEESTLNSKVGE